jgi:hypothetical protein
MGCAVDLQMKAMADSRWLRLIGSSRPTGQRRPAACINGRVSLTDERG